MNIGTIWLQDLPQEVLKYLTDLALKGGKGEIPVSICAAPGATNSPTVALSRLKISQ